MSFITAYKSYIIDVYYVLNDLIRHRYCPSSFGTFRSLRQQYNSIYNNYENSCNNPLIINLLLGSHITN